MRKILLATVLTAAVASLGAAQYHDPVYITGGYYPTTSTLNYNRGIWMADARNQRFTQLVQQGYYSYCQTMDSDNKRIVFSVTGTTSTLYPGVKSGLYRYDPGSGNLTTIIADPNLFYSVYNVQINQDGDYVFGCYRKNVSATTTYAYHVFKLSYGGTLTTLLSTAQLGFGAYFDFHMARNLDSGNLLVNNGSTSSASGMAYGLLDVADDGTFSTWSTGGSYGWYGRYNMPFDHDTGFIEGVYGSKVYQLKPGNTSRSTLWQLGYAGGVNLGSPCKFDLQSAANKRWVVPGYIQNPNGGQDAAIFHVDQKTYTVTGVNVDVNSTGVNNHRYFYDIDFFEGRHIQTAKVAPGKWQIQMSCPQYPNKTYALALGASGYRPGVKLPDGRRIHLNLDSTVLASWRGLMRPFFDPGPGVLDSNGRAIGGIDVSSVAGGGKLNATIWLAMVVLDPTAPWGIAYLPDTYVMRL